MATRKAKLGLGFGLAFAALLLGAWETLGIFDGHGGIPTISRVVQGIRDSSDVAGAIVVGVTLVIVVGGLAFLGWLFKHFLWDRRSSL